MAVQTRFRSLIDRLRADDRIAVLGDHLAKGATEAELAAAEKSFGFALAPDIRAFYAEMNGALVRWAPKDDEEFDALTPSEGTPDWSEPDWGAAGRGGAIYLWPIQRVASATWKEQIWFDFMNDDEKVQIDGQEIGQLTHAKAVRPFDLASDYQQAAFLINQGKGSPPVVLGDDHMACTTDSRVLDFSSYIELVLKFAGSFEARSSFMLFGFAKGGPRVETTAAYWAKLPDPDLTEPDAFDFGPIGAANAR